MNRKDNNNEIMYYASLSLFFQITVHNEFIYIIYDHF